ncbi:MAG: DUF92 domain-containing protein [Thermoplasmata archaeon]|nr:DUF92 domain-containing protein [Thermoplasmata archaeon]
MSIDPVTVLIGIAATAALSGVAIGSGALTLRAGLLAAAFGIVIVSLGGFPYLALMALFVLAGVLATRYGLEEKRRRNVQEGTAGERGVSNVVAHVVLPTALVVIASAAPTWLSGSETAFLYTSALAFGAADTFASEFGVLSGRARSILTGRPVTAGTNGGVSLLGEFWAIIGAAVTAVVGFGLFLLFHAPVHSSAGFLVGVIVAGFAGCQIDSVLGEVLENRGYLTKGSTNFLGMLSSIAFAAAFLLLASGWLS